MSADAERGQHTTGDERGYRRGDQSRSPLRRIERPLTATLGVALVVRGLRRRTLRGVLGALAGGWLLYRALRNRRLSSAEPTRATIDRGQEPGARGEPTVERSVTVDEAPDELQEYWHEPDHLSKIMGEFAQVTPKDDDQLHWRLDGPMGKSISWDTRVVEDEPGEVLRWETVEGTYLPSEWTVRFDDAPGDRGTEVRLRAAFDPPGGALGKAALNRFEFALDSALDTALHRFKSLAETGEIPTLEDNPSARETGGLA